MRHANEVMYHKWVYKIPINQKCLDKLACWVNYSIELSEATEEFFQACYLVVRHSHPNVAANGVEQLEQIIKLDVPIS